MHKVRMAIAVAAMLVPLASRCENQASPDSLPDGLTQLTKATRGFWKAPGGTSCRWWVTTGQKGGTITNPGNTQGPVNRRTQKPGRAADQSQTLLVGSGNVGQYLHSDNCAPKGWTK